MEYNKRALNDFDLNTYYKTAVEFTYEDLMTQRKGKSAAPDRRNMGYYASSQALRVRGKGNQIKWHPAVRAYFTSAHADPRDGTGTEVPEDMSGTMIEAWASEDAPEQAVLVAFAASRLRHRFTRPQASRTVTTRCRMPTWTGWHSPLRTAPRCSQTRTRRRP